MKHIRKYWLIIISLCFMSFLLVQSVGATDKIFVDLYYNHNCGTCKNALITVQEVEDHFINNTDVLVFEYKDIANDNDTIRAKYTKEYTDYQTKYGVGYPFVVVYNQTNLTIVRNSEIQPDPKILNETINRYLAGLGANNSNLNIVTIDVLFWKVTINMSQYSLPVLTAIFGGIDSFNPCAFFILIFLMNLLINMQSRKRMLLIGGIFVFFSGFIYFIFMAILLRAFLLTESALILTNINIIILTIAVGCVAAILGILNIKDFFFFKKGISLSIPESKKPGIFKRMRQLIKTTSLPAVIGSTIFLAISINFYELICSAIVPTAYINLLTHHHLSDIQYYQYIFFYNIVYVLPFIVIVLIFIFTLGRRHISEWQGRILKLFSGIMIFSFGLLFLINYQLLENAAIPIILLIASIILTWCISFVWKRYKEPPEKLLPDTNTEESEQLPQEQ